MPLYDYKCPECNDIKEISHSYDLDMIVICDECKIRCAKLISNPALKFIGSGFYCNDYKKE